MATVSLPDEFVVLDFETTGLSPQAGARATEIGAVLVRDGHIVARYQSLMNAGVRIPRFIQDLTGITPAMIRDAPSARLVIGEAADFIGDRPLVAHNAAFDRTFLDAELQRIHRQRRQDFACTLLLSRRLYPEAPNHRLGTLASYLDLPAAGRAHRALADAEVAAALILAIQDELRDRFRLPSVPHALLRAVQAAPKGRCAASIERFRASHGF